MHEPCMAEPYGSSPSSSVHDDDYLMRIVEVLARTDDIGYLLWDAAMHTGPVAVANACVPRFPIAHANALVQPVANVDNRHTQHTKRFLANFWEIEGQFVAKMKAVSPRKRISEASRAEQRENARLAMELLADAKSFPFYMCIDNTRAHTTTPPTSHAPPKRARKSN